MCVSEHNRALEEVEEGVEGRKTGWTPVHARVPFLVDGVQRGGPLMEFFLFLAELVSQNEYLMSNLALLDVVDCFCGAEKADATIRFHVQLRRPCYPLP